MKLFKKIIVIVVSVFLIFVLVSAGGIFYLTRGLDASSKLEVGSVDLSTIGDGIYLGKHSAGRWTNEISVTVKDNAITSVEVVKDVLFKKPEVTTELINRILEKQSTQVDVVAGSTVTVKAYLKAIENALKN